MKAHLLDDRPGVRAVARTLCGRPVDADVWIAEEPHPVTCRTCARLHAESPIPHHLRQLARQRALARLADLYPADYQYHYNVQLRRAQEKTS